MFACPLTYQQNRCASLTGRNLKIKPSSQWLISMGKCCTVTVTQFCFLKLWNKQTPGRQMFISIPSIAKTILYEGGGGDRRGSFTKFLIYRPYQFCCQQFLINLRTGLVPFTDVDCENVCVGMSPLPLTRYRHYRATEHGTKIVQEYVQQNVLKKESMFLQSLPWKISSTISSLKDHNITTYPLHIQNCCHLRKSGEFIPHCPLCDCGEISDQWAKLFVKLKTPKLKIKRSKQEGKFIMDVSIIFQKQSEKI